MSHCPPELESLESIDQLQVKSKVELLRTFAGNVKRNKYTIKNSLGQKVYWAVENPGLLDMKITDTNRTTVVTLRAPWTRIGWGLQCCLQAVKVDAPPGNMIGSVKEVWWMLKPRFAINNEYGETNLRIEGTQYCTECFCSDTEFTVVASFMFTFVFILV